MANSKYSRELDISNPMGIPAYDFIDNTYDSSDNLTLATYKLDNKVVATVAMTYDANGNVLTVTRTA